MKTKYKILRGQKITIYNAVNAIFVFVSLYYSNLYRRLLRGKLKPTPIIITKMIRSLSKSVLNFSWKRSWWFRCRRPHLSNSARQFFQDCLQSCKNAAVGPDHHTANDRIPPSSCDWVSHTWRIGSAGKVFWSRDSK